MSRTRDPAALRGFGPGHAGSPRQLHSFLTAQGLKVIEVGRGAAPGTRRLSVGRRPTSPPSHVVAVAAVPEAAPFVEGEARHVAELRARVGPEMRATLPEPVERVHVHDLPGVVFAAAPAPESSDQGDEAPTGPVLRWLTTLWSDTAGFPGRIDLGDRAYESLVSRLADSRRAAPVLRAVRRARERLGGSDLARTASHGCLCPRHVRVSGGRALSVEDWSLARLESEPLRDLGTWAVRVAGPDIGGVVSGRSAQARGLRELLAEGLGFWGLSSRLWLDVLVLALAEAAAEGLEAQDTAPTELLAALSQDLPSSTTGRSSS